MGREEIAAEQTLELAKAAEQAIAETEGEGNLARERLDAAAAALSAPRGRPGLEAEPAAAGPERNEGEVAAAPQETADFADIAARIAGND